MAVPQWEAGHEAGWDRVSLSKKPASHWGRDSSRWLIVGHRPGSADVWASPRTVRLGASGEDGERGRAETEPGKDWCVAQDSGRGCGYVTGDRPGRGGCCVGQTVVFRRFGDIAEMKEGFRAPQACVRTGRAAARRRHVLSCYRTWQCTHKSKQKSERARPLGMRTAQSKMGWAAELRPGLTRTLT